MFNSISDWFSDIKEEMNGLAQQQREAELDLLILMMYADRNIDDNENSNIAKQSNSLRWENKEYHVSLYIDKTVAKVRNIITDKEKLSLFIEDISTRLDDKETKDSAFVSVEKFMEIDFDISEKERELLATIKEIFA